MPKIKKKDINGWIEEEEQILKEWADKALCYKWMHSKSHEYYRNIHACFVIPVIIISTITGTANFSLERFDEYTKNIAIMVIGAFNILAGIISTIAQFLKISEINEGHRTASASWDKFYRNIKLELAKNPVDRRPAKEFSKYCKEEYDRLVETSPAIRQHIINDFNKEFKSNNIIKPEITGDVREINVFDRAKIEYIDDDTDEDDDEPIIKLKDLDEFSRDFFELQGRQPDHNDIKMFFASKKQNIGSKKEREKDKAIIKDNGTGALSNSNKIRSSSDDVNIDHLELDMS